MPSPPWFRARTGRFSRGWMPVTWQGWLVFLAFFALVLFGIYLFPPRQSLAAFVLYVVVLSALLTLVCWLKGEPPRWRWGND